MAQIKTTAESREFLEELRRRSLGRPNMWARAAIGLSLAIAEEPETGPFDNGGTEFKFGTLFGEDEAIFEELLVERHQRRLANDEMPVLVKAHVERGLRLLREEFNRLNRKGDELMLSLLRSHSTNPTQIASSPSWSRQPDSPKDGSLLAEIEIGAYPASGIPVLHRINTPGQAPHIAIMGKNGTGKTRLALSLLTRLRKACGPNLGMLVFDYAKGDIGADTAFIRGVQAQAVRLPEQQLPFDPLSVPNQDQHTIQIAARRIRDTIGSVVHLGAVQRHRCLDLLVTLYQDSRPDTPTLQNLAAHADLLYQQNNWKQDSLSAVINDFGTFPLFTPSTEGATLLTESLVLDVHELPHELRKLTTFLILDRLYWEIMNLPDAPIDVSGNRQLRYVIAIDEAHHFLPCKQATLEKMIREVRSKGVLVMLMSQSPDDFDQPNYNFAREMGLSFVFPCFIDRPKMLESLFGSPIDIGRVMHLQPGVALTKPQSTEHAIEVKVW